ncbi:MAG: phytanoyl-CoA dioxygenase, partial [Gemmatimonadetes bacterium]|nr:phytanoyl-CoA dioxygenase [Gemmatimonadota bacterium]
MVDEQYLLTTKQMAQFVADGFLRFDELVPHELNRAACAEMEAGVPRGRAGAPLAELWTDAVVGQVVRLPQIQGIIHSLVGPGPLYD